MTPKIALEHVSRDWSHEQIAQKFGVPEQTVGLSIAGALNAIRSSSRLNNIIPCKLPNPLEARETEVARLILSGVGNKAIAREMFIAEKTVKNYVSQIFKKLGVTSRTQAAIKLQFIDFHA